jgi:hypothetical protein
MVRNRFLLLVQGLFLCAFLVAGAYTLSIFQDYGMRLFKEKSMLQASYAAKQLTESLNKGASREQLEAESAELAKEMEINLRLLDVADSDVSEAVRAYLGGGMGASVRSDEQGDLRTLYLAEPLGGRLILQAAFPLKRFAAEYDKVRVFVLVAFVFLMLLAAVLARFLVLKMLQPFEEIEAAAQKMAQGKKKLISPLTPAPSLNSPFIVQNKPIASAEPAPPISLVMVTMVVRCLGSVVITADMLQYGISLAV